MLHENAILLHFEYNFKMAINVVAAAVCFLLGLLSCHVLGW